MPKKSKKKASRDEINQILIEELDIELDESLTPTTKIEPIDDEDLLVHYILIRIENELLIEIPDEAANKIHSVQDVYNLVDSLQKNK